mmetsp:Transcript_34098/g.52992  ORF Transcript_34098/g.52992 Transcript_34098/m.52992 type:complete len:86 (-) Transcript_34098:35-292(-)
MVSLVTRIMVALTITAAEFVYVIIVSKRWQGTLSFWLPLMNTVFRTSATSCNDGDIVGPHELNENLRNVPTVVDAEMVATLELDV